MVDFFSPQSDLSKSNSVVACTQDKIIGYVFISNLDWLTNSQTLYELFMYPLGQSAH